MILYDALSGLGLNGLDAQGYEAPLLHSVLMSVTLSGYTGIDNIT
ncbi:MAG TPA: hypothetical protein VIQ51_01210 [Chryseosolibacter sp.]